MTPEETMTYYVDAIEEWRKDVEIESFIFAGYSFGGYIVAHYAELFPSRTSELILLSFAGISKLTEE